MNIRVRGSPQYTWWIVMILCLTGSISAVAELDWVRVTTDFNPPRRDGHNMVFDMQNQLSISFGAYAGDRDQPLHVYDGINWAPIEPFGDWPPSRTHFGMAYDASRNVVVIFGGFQGGFDYLGDTWEWDGEQWEEKFPEHSPEDRNDHSMTYVDSLNMVCLFGGYVESLHPSNQIWTWDGLDWTEVTPPTSPSARGGSPIVYDSSRDRVLLFGGTDDGNTELRDTWEWDGNEWEEIVTENSPTGKRNHTLVFDANRGISVLFGGNDDPMGMSDQTWEYDGVDWTQINPVHHPSERGFAAACYDSGRDRIVLYGGYTWTGSSNETWEYYDVPTPTPSPTVTPSPTATPLVTGATIDMPSHLFHPGDTCYCTVSVTNANPNPLTDHPLFMILDVFGDYFFAPSFTQTPDHYPGPWPAGVTVIDALQPFEWPDTGTSASGIIWYAALTDSAVTRIVGEWDSWEFGWE